MDISKYQAMQFSPQPCWELVAAVIADRGEELPVGYKTVNRSLRQMASEFRLALHKSAHGYTPVNDPVDGCIVLLGKTDRIGIHHCGIYHEGKVLHAMPDATLYEELSVIRDRFAIVEFWARA